MMKYKVLVTKFVRFPWFKFTFGKMRFHGFNGDSQLVQLVSQASPLLSYFVVCVGNYSKLK